MQNTIHIQSYNIVDFLVEIEKNVKNGYTFDFVSIGNFPQLVGGTFIVGMVKDAEKEVKKPQNPQKAQEEVVAEQTTEGTQEQSEAAVEAPKKAGRPAKGK